MKSTITKAYSRKLSYNYNSEEFSTAETRDIEYENKEEYMKEQTKLAARVKVLTEKDMEQHSELLKEARANGQVEET